ncbi:MAG: hypothetical protein BGP25_06760 [Lysobacterales bacterium 63-13]|nr:MAG: hypothetical protein BGP25_06760 [Xanthomonadales bacterium 63-13]
MICSRQMKLPPIAQTAVLAILPTCRENAALRPGTASADCGASATLGGRLASCMAWVVEECQAAAVRICLPLTPR